MGRYLAIPLLLLLAGCGYQQLQQGEPNFNTAILLPGYTAASPAAVSSRDVGKLELVPLDLPAACKNVNGTPVTDSTTTKNIVNGCVFAIVTIIDDLYREYRITLHHFADDGNAVADISVLGLTTAATGPIGATTGKVLTGVAAFVTGSKSVINQDLLYKQTIENIIHQMDADRASRLNIINASIGGAGYTLAMAKDDLLLYFAAGTWDDAITTMQTTLATNQANCQAQADQSKIIQAQTTSGSGSGGGAPAPTSSNCQPAASPPPPLTYKAVTAGLCFQQSGTLAIFKVSNPPPSATGQMTVTYAPDGQTFLPGSLTPTFPGFAIMVNPVPVKCPSP